ncbi:hypothetical protein PT974_04498 [Cladobotryum mycophilum]|uniref:Uncharacterized protein n=1 Tax=Cladobotryum mycophilum TaxID=491253 RepID=A0ABR0SV66_9HYPO
MLIRLRAFIKNSTHRRDWTTVETVTTYSAQPRTPIETLSIKLYLNHSIQFAAMTPSITTAMRMPTSPPTSHHQRYTLIPNNVLFATQNSKAARNSSTPTSPTK